MQLSKFITTNTERILAEFEAFARDIDASGTMDIAALRDHAGEMLKAIARDMDTPQTLREGTDKSKGRSDAADGNADTPAQEHGSDRATSGFTFGEMVSEYRALRATVIRLWSEELAHIGPRDLEDLVRFNESVDQALAESTARFTEDLDRTRETFLGILGHDLRSPLGAVITSAQFLIGETKLEPVQRTLLETILSSGQRMTQMVAALLDFTRGRLGVGMPVVRETFDFGGVLAGAVEEMKAYRPDSDIVLTMSGDLACECDAARLRQVLSNLLSNALNHGASDGPITVTACGDTDRIVFSVHNNGPPIPEEQLDHIFEPLMRLPTASRDSHHMGLGLYIAHQVVSGHDGSIEVESSEGHGTTFTVTIPRSST